MNVWNDTDSGQQKYQRAPSPVPLCPPHNSHGVVWPRLFEAVSPSRKLLEHYTPYMSLDSQSPSSSLRMETEWVSETSEDFKQLTGLSAREDFIHYRP
jgi:hypothetical protein